MNVIDASDLHSSLHRIVMSIKCLQLTVFLYVTIPFLRNEILRGVIAVVILYRLLYTRLSHKGVVVRSNEF